MNNSETNIFLLKKIEIATSRNELTISSTNHIDLNFWQIDFINFPQKYI